MFGVAKEAREAAVRAKGVEIKVHSLLWMSAIVDEDRIYLRTFHKRQALFKFLEYG